MKSSEDREITPLPGFGGLLLRIVVEVELPGVGYLHPICDDGLYIVGRLGTGALFGKEENGLKGTVIVRSAVCSVTL